MTSFAIFSDEGGASAAPFSSSATGAPTRVEFESVAGDSKKIFSGASREEERVVSPASLDVAFAPKNDDALESLRPMGATERAVPMECLPGDGISSIKFAPNNSSKDFMLCSSWDGTVRLYDTAPPTTISRCQRAKYSHERAVLDCTFDIDADKAYSAGLDRTITMHDWTTGRSDVIGTHAESVSKICTSPETGLVLSGGWDGQVKLWDPRSREPLVASAPQLGKVFSLDAFGSSFIVATSGRHINVYDVRSMDAPREARKSSLKYQTRCVRVFPGHHGFATGSIEGRVAVEYFPGAGKHKFSFKCHRIKDCVYPVNCIAMHPVHGTFATGGCDGFVNVWDSENKKRVAQFPQFHTSIAALDFNADGTTLAIAASYTWEQGPQSRKRDAIVLRQVSDKEVKPKQKRSSK